MNVLKSSINSGLPQSLDRLFNALWREGLAERRRARGATAVLTFPGGAEFAASVRSACALDRLCTEPPYLIRRASGAVCEAVEDPADVLDLLPRGSGDVSRFCEEVRQSARNMDAFAALAGGRLGELGGGPGGLLARALRAAPGGVEPEAYLESWILRGHAAHPGAKTRGGFGEQDLLRYSPESGGCFGLRFAAVRREMLVERGSGAGYPRPWVEALAAELGRRGLAASSYEAVAVHPWQLDNALPSVFGPELSDRTIVPLDSSFPVRPLVSLRTLVPVTAPGEFHLKLPVAVQATSVLRTITVPTVENSPAVSAMLERALRASPDLARLLEVQAEPRTLHYAASPERAKHLALIFRRPPAPVPGLWTVPAALLAETSPIDGRPVVCELVERRGAGPEAFLRAYAALSAKAVLGLVLRHGIALEAHAQNILVRCQEGLPVSFVTRDLGALKILRAWAGPDAAALHPDSLVEAKDPEDLFTNVHHAWLQGLLAPVVCALGEAYGLGERVFWGLARRAAEETIEQVGGPRAGEARRLLFGPRVRVKALARMRLAGNSPYDEFCEVANPFWKAA